MPRDFPLPVIPGAQVMWVQTSSDPKETMALLSWQGTVAAAADFYENALTEAGFEEVERFTVQAPNVVAVQLTAYGAGDASVAIQQTAGQSILQIVLSVSQ